MPFLTNSNMFSAVLPTPTTDRETQVANCCAELIEIADRGVPETTMVAAFIDELAAIIGFTVPGPDPDPEPEPEPEPTGGVISGLLITEGGIADSDNIDVVQAEGIFELGGIPGSGLEFTYRLFQGAVIAIINIDNGGSGYAVGDNIAFTVPDELLEAQVQVLEVDGVFIPPTEPDPTPDP